MELIKYEDFAKLDIRIGLVLSAEKVEGADKLLKLRVKVGEEERTLVAGIALCYSAEEMIGKKIIVLANLETKKLRGIESQGMLLAAGENADNLAILTVTSDMPEGTKIH